MQRNRTVVVVSHCLLNANARVSGLADYAGVHPVVEQITVRGIGLIQLPCPELDAEGFGRSPQPIEHYDTSDFRERCRNIAKRLADQIVSLRAEGVRVDLVLGVEGSPTCGVRQTNVAADDLPDGRVSVRAPGAGVLMQELQAVLDPLGVRLEGLDHRDADGGLAVGIAALDACMTTEPCVDQSNVPSVRPHP